MNATARLLEETHSATYAEMCFRVAAWMGRQKRLSVADIAREFQVSRSTAYRWLAAWVASQGATVTPKGREMLGEGKE